MIRRDFFKTPLALAGVTLGSPVAAAAAAGAEELATAPGLTRYISEFIVNTKYEDIPEDVVTLGKKTMLDGFGLALAGSASVIGPVVRQYIDTLGLTNGRSSTVVGTAMKTPPRFAALANGVSIHADDYDDTGSALHVTAPVLPSAFALCEVGRRSGKDLMLAKTRSATLSSPVTTGTGSIRPAPAAPSAAPRHARSFAGSPSCRPPARSGSPRRRPAASGAISAR